MSLTATEAIVLREATTAALAVARQTHERLRLLEHDLSAVRIALAALLTTATKEQLQVVGARLITDPGELSQQGREMTEEDADLLRDAMANLHAAIRQRLAEVHPEQYPDGAPPSQPEGG